ncbi:hypothetical protein N300_09398, partial [Calypte anna]
FAFTIPALNREAPASRSKWVVLPQGMKNIPTLCQLFVDAAVLPVRKSWPDVLIYHYMDDILIAQQDPFTEQQEYFLAKQLNQQGLQVAPEKIQCAAPWRYLGWQITESQTRPPKAPLHLTLKTLHDVQQFLGDVQWLRPVVGITKDQLELLRPLLKSTDPASPVTLSIAQQQAIVEIGQTI